MPRSISVPLTDASLVGEARRLATELARNLGFSDAGKARIALVVTETATNALRHGKNARLLLRTLHERTGGGIEVVSVDSGRGMTDIDRCLEDGYSTGGSAGTGLGAIQRLSNVFDIYSQADAGTVLLAQVWGNTDSRLTLSLDVGCVCVAKAHEEACGDLWAFQSRPDSDLFMLADGLGHGPSAAQAADEAGRVFETDRKSQPKEIVEASHGPLRATRGASLAVAEVCFNQGLLRYAAVGNISGRVLSGGASRSLVSHAGTVGYGAHRVQEFSYPWPADALLVLHSDGLLTRWSLDAYPSLVLHHPAVIAGVLYRDFERGRDDLTVLVARDAADVMRKPFERKAAS